MLRMVFILFLSAALLAGCAAGEQPQWGEPGKAVTFRVACRGNLDPEFVYRIAVDTDGNALTGPSSNPSSWEKVYVLEWRNGVCSLLSPDGVRTYILGSTFSGQTAEATVDLEALGNPDQIEVMALVEDGGGNILDHLQTFFRVRLKDQRFVTRTDEEGDASEPSADILRVSIEVSF